MGALLQAAVCTAVCELWLHTACAPPLPTEQVPWLSRVHAARGWLHMPWVQVEGVRSMVLKAQAAGNARAIDTELKLKI